MIWDAQMFSEAPARRSETGAQNGSCSSATAVDANQKVLISVRGGKTSADLGELEGFSDA